MISVRGVWFRYPRARRRGWTLEDVSFETAAGERVAVVGPNGAGKSTLCRVVIGALRADRGEVEISGTSVRRLHGRALAGRAAFVSGASGSGSPLRAGALVALGRRLRPGGSAAVDEVVERLELGALLDEPVWSLSAGQRQRVSLGRAAAQVWDAPGATLVADEATSAMDPRHAALALELFDALSERGVGVMAAMHDLTMARRFASSAVALGAGGRVASHGMAAEALSVERLRTVFGIDFLETASAAGPIVTAVRRRRDVEA